ncbi:MAG: cation:proton antiporter [Pseudorhodobacter sp.]
MVVLVIFVLLVFCYSLISNQVARTRLTAPIIFTLAGIITGIPGPDVQNYQFTVEIFLTIAELGLVLLLFTDGSRVSFEFRGGLRSIPGRLLSTGMLLSIVLGLLVAMVVFGDLSIWEAGILAAILAPTDAGLGQAIVSDPRVPIRIRQALNVEAGLNDGLSVPFLLFFIALATGGGTQGADASLPRYFLEQFGYGTLIGLVIGYLGGKLFIAAARRGWVSAEFRQLGFAALPILCVLASIACDASMFIAAFVAGLAVRHRRRKSDYDITAHSLEFAEYWGGLINLTVFFLFGLLVAETWGDLSLSHILYAVLSLTLIRMVPVAVALTGLGLQRRTVLFMGWFGPRGLASIVLGLVYLEQTAERHLQTIEMAVIATVLLSILLHGISARPGARRFGALMDSLPANIPEKLARGLTPKGLVKRKN